MFVTNGTAKSPFRTDSGLVRPRIRGHRRRVCISVGARNTFGTPNATRMCMFKQLQRFGDRTNTTQTFYSVFAVHIGPDGCVFLESRTFLPGCLPIFMIRTLAVNCVVFFLPDVLE
jgi:hypothetical protein